VPQSALLTRHSLGLLRADVLLLRQLGAWGLTLQLCSVVDHRVAAPEVVAEVQAWLAEEGAAGEARPAASLWPAMRSPPATSASLCLSCQWHFQLRRNWRSPSRAHAPGPLRHRPAPAAALVRHLVSDHTQLDIVEAGKDKRGGGGAGGLLTAMQRALAATLEEKLSSVVRASMGRLGRWVGGVDGRGGPCWAGCRGVRWARRRRLWLGAAGQGWRWQAFGLLALLPGSHGSHHSPCCRAQVAGVLGRPAGRHGRGHV
jgi:hypothetical protein